MPSWIGDLTEEAVRAQREHRARHHCIISKQFRFEASHILPKHPGKCSRLHGHSWVGWVAVSGPVNEGTGFVVDYAALGAMVDTAIVQRLDHQHLGLGTCHPGQMPQLIAEPPFGVNFYPSSENLVVAIASLIKPFIPELAPEAHLHSVRLAETCTCEAVWYNEGAHRA